MKGLRPGGFGESQYLLDIIDITAGDGRVELKFNTAFYEICGATQGRVE
jgi:hypothetical protein